MGTTALQHGKFLNGNVSFPNVAPVLILRRYMLFGLVPAEMEIRVKFLEILQVEFELACKYSGAQLGRVFSRHANPFNNNICAVLAFENSIVHIELSISIGISDLCD